MGKYKIITFKYFERRYLKLLKKQPKITIRVVKVFKLLRTDPFQISLKTHKVISKKYGEKWVSYVSRDIRIIWDFDSNEIRVIMVMDIGGHSGKNKIYK
ncbi:MAG: type II toxin-antitoxin system mRNA interferase toxin, RelE/StbE family [Patescibacteria group bacterium]|nr:type II toxin-antitoxin system mRNA interferase toxin, RelE/StbE family [Patescibacteria group bacterium]